LARRRNRKRGGQAVSLAWPGIVLGLAAGLAVTAWVYFGERVGAPEGARPAIKAPPSPAPAKVAPKTLPPADERFTFYDTLPELEVVVPDPAQDVRRGRTEAPVVTPGAHVLQAGSFPDFAQADAVKARLALLGISAGIQTVPVDGRVFHRVRVGPVEDLAELNRMRARLRQNDIEFIIVRIAQ
jgi:cell division protein FtsN